MTTGRIICHGEILLRLSSSPGEMLLQSPSLQVCAGGAEANVAVSLARLGHAAAMTGTLADNPLGHAVRDALRGHGVDTGSIRLAPGRLGVYYLVPGAVLRPAEILYDRADSAFAMADPADYDWPALLAGASWLHLSGVSPAVGPRAARAALDAADAAVRSGVRVAFDGNYRASLWHRQQSDGADVLHELLSHADLAFADQRDIALVLRRPELARPECRTTAAQAAFAAFPRLRALAATVRTQYSINHHALAATLHTRDSIFETDTVQVPAIVDRIGTGDAFAAGMLHGMLRGWSEPAALDFALAATVTKHSISGDFNLASEPQIMAIAQGALDVRR